MIEDELFGLGQPIEVFTTGELAERWKCSDGQVRRLVGNGQLRSFRLGKLVRISRNAVEEYEGWRNIELSRIGGNSPSSSPEPMASESADPSEQVIVVKLSPRCDEL